MHTYYTHATTCHMPQHATSHMPQHATTCHNMPQCATTCHSVPQCATTCHNMYRVILLTRNSSVTLYVCLITHQLCKFTAKIRALFDFLPSFVVLCRIPLRVYEMHPVGLICSVFCLYYHPIDRLDSIDNLPRVMPSQF